MKLIGIQTSSYTSKVNNQQVIYYYLAFSPNTTSDTIGVMARVYQAKRQAVDSICRLAFGGNLQNMIGEDFDFTFDQYHRIVALYLNDYVE